MSMTIWKYAIPPDDGFVLRMPTGAQILHVEAQIGAPQLWALVDPDKPLIQRSFHVYGTGHPIAVPESLRYVGTFQMVGGQYIFHLFESEDR